MCKYSAMVEVGVPESELKQIQGVLKELGGNWNVEANLFKKEVTPEPSLEMSILTPAELQWWIIINLFLNWIFCCGWKRCLPKIKEGIEKIV